MISQLMSGIEVAGGLVGDEQPRVVDQGSGYGRPLLLAAGELAGELVRLSGQADDREDAIDGRIDGAPPGAGDLQREGHVVADGLVRQELEVLEDDADLAPDLWNLAALEPRQVPAVEEDHAFGRHLVANEELDHRRLAGARWPDQEDEVALGHDQVHAAQSHAAVRVGLGDALHRQHDPGGDGIARALAGSAGLARFGSGGRRAHHDHEASTDPAGSVGVAAVTTATGWQARSARRRRRGGSSTAGRGSPLFGGRPGAARPSPGRWLRVPRPRWPRAA